MAAHCARTVPRIRSPRKAADRDTPRLLQGNSGLGQAASPAPKNVLPIYCGEHTRLASCFWRLAKPNTSMLLAPLFHYECEQDHESEADRNSRVATGLILPNVPRFHRL